MWYRRKGSPTDSAKPRLSVPDPDQSIFNPNFKSFHKQWVTLTLLCSLVYWIWLPFSQSSKRCKKCLIRPFLWVMAVWRQRLKHLFVSLRNTLHVKKWWSELAGFTQIFSLHELAKPNLTCNQVRLAINTSVYHPCDWWWQEACWCACFTCRYREFYQGKEGLRLKEFLESISSAITW